MTSTGAIEALATRLKYRFKVRQNLERALVLPTRDDYECHDGNRMLARLGHTVLNLLVDTAAVESGDSRSTAHSSLNGQLAREKRLKAAELLDLSACLTCSPRQGNKPLSNGSLEASVLAILGAVWVDSGNNIRAARTLASDLLIAPTNQRRTTPSDSIWTRTSIKYLDDRMAFERQQCLNFNLPAPDDQLNEGLRSLQQTTRLSESSETWIRYLFFGFGTPAIIQSFGQGWKAMRSAEYEGLWRLPEPDMPLHNRLGRIFQFEEASEMQATIRRCHIYEFHLRLDHDLRSQAEGWIIEDGQGQKRAKGNPQNLAKKKIAELINAMNPTLEDPSRVKFLHKRALEVHRLGTHFAKMVEHWSIGALALFGSPTGGAGQQSLPLSDKLLLSADPKEFAVIIEAMDKLHGHMLRELSKAVSQPLQNVLHGNLFSFPPERPQRDILTVPRTHPDFIQQVEEMLTGYGDPDIDVDSLDHFSNFGIEPGS